LADKKLLSAPTKALGRNTNPIPTQNIIPNIHTSEFGWKYGYATEADINNIPIKVVLICFILLLLNIMLIVIL